MQIYQDHGAISCNVCTHCIEPCRRVEGPKKRPRVTMLGQSRANGMWHGPDPPELQDLSYAECKVINLAHIYVSVKRVFLDRSSYARTTKSETPLYHQSNVVAYPQNPDAALTAVGMGPQTLAKMLMVQFVDSDR